MGAVDSLLTRMAWDQTEGVGANSLPCTGRMMHQLLAYQGTEDGEYVILGEDRFEFGPVQDGSYVAEGEPTDLGR